MPGLMHNPVKGTPESESCRGKWTIRVSKWPVGTTAEMPVPAQGTKVWSCRAARAAITVNAPLFKPRWVKPASASRFPSASACDVMPLQLVRLSRGLDIYLVTSSMQANRAHSSA